MDGNNQKVVNFHTEILFFLRITLCYPYKGIIELYKRLREKFSNEIVWHNHYPADVRSVIGYIDLDKNFV